MTPYKVEKTSDLASWVHGPGVSRHWTHEHAEIVADRLNAAYAAGAASRDAVIKSLDGHLVTDHGFCRICGKRVWGIGNNHADECPVPGVVACMVATNSAALAASIHLSKSDASTASQPDETCHSAPAESSESHKPS